MNKAGGKSQTAQANILGGRNPAFPRDHILALHCATVVSFKPFLPNVAYTQEEPNVYTSELGRNGLREIFLSLFLSPPGTGHTLFNLPLPQLDASSKQSKWTRQLLPAKNHLVGEGEGPNSQGWQQCPD